MKNIDAEKLIAEIERRREKCADAAADERNEEVAEYYRGKEVAYDETSTLITSLQQEQPEPSCKSCGFYENNCPFIRGKFIPYPNKVCKDYTYSVMKEQEQPSLPSNLDEAAEKFAHLYDNGTCDGIAQECFKAGAEWMAGQGETVEGEIVCAVAHPHENKVIARVYGDYKFGDKVVVQIRKNSNHENLSEL